MILRPDLLIIALASGLLLPLGCSSSHAPAATAPSPGVPAPSTLTPAHAATTPGGTVPKNPSAVLVAGLVGAARVTRWDPGVVGGIPIRTKVCATLKASGYGNGTKDSSHEVQKAVDACPEGQVVQLSAGTFKWKTSIRLNKGITLRGAGVGQTSVTGEIAYLYVGPIGPPQNAISTTLVDHTNLSSDAKKGTSTLAVADGSKYEQGDLAVVSMKDDSTIFPPPGPGGDFLLWTDPDGSRHSNGQTVMISAVSGNTLTIDGVLHSDYTVKNGAVVGRASSYVEKAGVEGIRFVSPAPVAFFTLCDQCWLTGSESDTSDGDTAWWVSRRGEMRQNYIHHSKTYSQGGGGYGVTLNAYTSDSLVEDNVIFFFNKPFLFRSSGGGNVVAYNYIDGAQNSASPFWMEPDIDSHMVYSHMELVEGNLCGAVGLINTWGGAGPFMIFRNRILGQHRDPNLINVQDSNQAAITLNAGMGAYSSILGNVLGSPDLKVTVGDQKGKPAYYENVSEKDVDDPPKTAAGYGATQLIMMYRLGNGSVSGAYGSFDVDETPYPDVPKVAPTVIRHHNFDYVTNSVIDDPNVTLTDLPPSLYRVGKPEFFGDRTWPWVEADGDTKAFSLPAKERFDAIKSVARSR